MAKFRTYLGAIWIAGVCVIVLGSLRSHAQESTVSARVELLAQNRHGKKNPANVVVWLTPAADQGPVRPAAPSDSAQHPRLVQRDKRFQPHLLVVPAGTAVEFPNHDPFFHNVFSLFEGKRFDLGLYEAGTTRLVHFDRVGISYIFCNIHPEMSAVVIALETPYYAISDSTGAISIPGVPPGKYLMQVWAEGTSPENLKSLNREISISGPDHSLGIVRVTEDSLPEPHKNKYGRDYDAPGTDYPPAEPK